LMVNLWLAAAGGAGPALAQGGESDEATFVFRGTVTAAQSSTLEQLPASDETYTVQVDEVLFQGGTFGDQTGKQVTAVDSSRSLKVGSRYTLHTQPFLFGESIAVTVLEAATDRPTGTATAASTRRALEHRAMRQRVAQAGLVVQGSVVSVSRLAPSQRFESEHLPDLHRALVKVDEVLKGDLSRNEISFLFAASMDVHYFRAPKFQVGDEGIFLLNAATPEAPVAGLAAQQWTVMDRRDYQPASSSETIRTLVQELPTQESDQ